MTTTSQDVGTPLMRSEAPRGGSANGYSRSRVQLLDDQVPERGERLEVFEKHFLGLDGDVERLFDVRNELEDAQRIDEALTDDVGIRRDCDGFLAARFFLNEKRSQGLEDLLVRRLHLAARSAAQDSIIRYLPRVEAPRKRARAQVTAKRARALKSADCKGLTCGCECFEPAPAW